MLARTASAVSLGKRYDMFMPNNLTNEELIRHVQNSMTATPIERLLAARLAEAVDEIEELLEHPEDAY